MEPVPAPEAAPSQHSGRRRRRVREPKTGRLSIGVQLGIIVAAVGISVWFLLAFLGLVGEPAKPVQVDQKLIDSYWVP
jgi:hypothetical protein